MKRLYPILLFVFIILSTRTGAQVTGDVCGNPIVLQLCNSTTSTVSTNSFTNNTSTWHVGSTNIQAKGADIFYQINLPNTGYQPVSISAQVAGYLTCNNCNNKIYFLWFTGSPCSSNPVAVDSDYISGTSSLPDSLFSSYNIGTIQSTYYLVIDFSLTNTYQYSLQAGFNNNQPQGQPTCSAQPAPYKGKLELDQSSCYTSASPYQLPLSMLNDQYIYSNVLLPSSLNQLQNYLPINDDNKTGFVLSLKQTDVSNDEVYIAYDQFPYKFLPPNLSGGANDVAFTIFLKNNGGASGLKGFRIQMPGGTANNVYVQPTGTGAYSTNGTWVSNYDAQTSTYTWLFNSPNGRGDNTDNNGYSCKVYTFTGQFKNMGDTIKAWYLPDNYGNDTTQCVYPARTDCGLQPGNFTDGWIQIGAGAGGSGITGSSCSNGISYCNPGNEYWVESDYPGGNDCEYFESDPNSDCPPGFYGDGPYVEYDSTGCATQIIPEWNLLTPLIDWSLQFQSNAIFQGICSGSAYHLNLYNYGLQPGIPTYIAYIGPVGQFYPVDSLGNINYNINLSNTCSGNIGLPVYPVGNFSIPLHVPGSYTLFFSYNFSNITSCSNCGGIGTLVLTADTAYTTFSPASTDSSVCRGTYFGFIPSNSSITFTWVPDSVTTGSLNNRFAYYIKPYQNTTYTGYGTDLQGCKDTVTYEVRVHDCQPQAIFTSDNGCPQLCNTFSNSSGGAPSYQRWRFPGGTPSSFIGANPPKVCYPKKGLFPVTLFVSNAFGQDSTTNYVDIGCGESIVMTVNDSVVCGNCVNFYNHIGAYAYQYFWHFPGGTPSFDSTTYFRYNFFPDSLHICYADTGYYTATAISVDPYYGNDTMSVRIYITKCGLGPTAAFNSPDSICASQCINYADASTNNPSTWQWTFNGGSPSSFSGQTPPRICYATPGNYQTRLVASNSVSSDTAFKTIKVGNCKPIAQFAPTDTTICLNGCLNFTNLSLNSTSWQWSFPGGKPTSYNGFQPQPVCYNIPDSFDVSLIAINNYGADTLVLHGIIKVVLPPQPHITQKADTLSCTTAATYQWYFSDVSINGATSNTYIAQQDGEYKVFVTDAHGCEGVDSLNVINTQANNLFKEGGIKISPNPTDGRLQVTGLKLQVDEVEVYNTLGERIYTDVKPKTQQPSTITIDLSSYPEGIYYLRVETSTQTFVNKIVVSR